MRRIDSQKPCSHDSVQGGQDVPSMVKHGVNGQTTYMQHKRFGAMGAVWSQTVSCAAGEGTLKQATGS